ncbi:ComEA family DNA-binding protein [Nocardia sp. NPDC050718]|uniref:ComEA family DNA-binding protein n=1 Tax=Nocardia sp. NPDC050718 TaxID=3155788 RepID=UPI003402439A
MSRHDEHERVRQRLGGLALRDKPGSGSLRGEPDTARPRRSTEGRWDEEELPSTGEVRSPGWLDEGADSGRLRRLVPDRFRQARVDPGRRGALVLGLVGVAAVVCTGALVLRDQPTSQSLPPVPVVRVEPSGTHSEPSAGLAAVAGAMPSPTAEVVVSVVGLVERPGLHHLPGGARVADAIERAGGATEGADLAGLNLAQRLTDGDQVVVGTTGPQTGPPRLGSVMIGAADRAPAAGQHATSGPPPNTGTPNAKTRVNLNTATEAELDALPGVGPVTAKAILAWRTTNGRFTDVAQLGEVDGIGPARLTRLRDLVTT